MKRINVLVRQDQYKELKLVAQNSGTTVSTLVRDYVDIGFKKKLRGEKAPGKALLRLSKRTFKDRKDVAIKHDKYLYA